MASTKKSPFIVIENFISPLLCEEIVQVVGFEPTADISKTVHDGTYQQKIAQKIQYIQKGIDIHFQTEIVGLAKLGFEWIQQDSFLPVLCDSCQLINGQWIKNVPYDFTGVVFLSEYNDHPPFDLEYECYGGKLEFPSHQFSFNPTRGVCVVFPSDPRFSNATSLVKAGDAYQIRFHLKSKHPYIYQPKNFPGNYTSWFK